MDFAELGRQINSYKGGRRDWRFEDDAPITTNTELTEDEQEVDITATTDAIIEQTEKIEESVDSNQEKKDVEAADKNIDDLENQKQETEMLMDFISRNGIDDTVLALYNSHVNPLLDQCAGYRLPRFYDNIDRTMTRDVLNGLQKISNNISTVLKMLYRIRRY